MDDQTPPADKTAAKRADGRIDRLLDFWGNRSLAEITAKTCAAYVEWRGNAGGARRDLEDLQAAINYHRDDKHLHRGHVEVAMPPRGGPRTRWLTRSEAAALVWVCWRHRETQKAKHGVPTDDRVVTDKRPLRHIARFILLGLYTGTRAGAIASASYYASSGRSYVDLESGIFFRLAQGKKATAKRQPPVPLPPRLLAHMRRWKAAAEARKAADPRRVTNGFVVEFYGKPVLSVKTGFASAVKKAGLEGKVTPHTLRHTAATWLMHDRVSQFDASGYLGMSMQTLDKVYAHQDTRRLEIAANAIGNGQRLANKKRGEMKNIA